MSATSGDQQDEDLGHDTIDLERYDQTLSCYGGASSVRVLPTAIEFDFTTDGQKRLGFTGPVRFSSCDAVEDYPKAIEVFSQMSEGRCGRCVAVCESEGAICPTNTWGTMGSEFEVVNEMCRLSPRDGTRLLTVYSANSVAARCDWYAYMGHRVLQVTDDKIIAEGGFSSEHYTERRLRKVLGPLPGARNRGYRLSRPTLASAEPPPNKALQSTASSAMQLGSGSLPAFDLRDSATSGGAVVRS